MGVGGLTKNKHFDKAFVMAASCCYLDVQTAPLWKRSLVPNIRVIGPKIPAGMFSPRRTCLMLYTFADIL